MPISKDEIKNFSKAKSDKEIAKLLEAIASSINDKTSLEQIASNVSLLEKAINSREKAITNVNVELDKSINDGVIQVLNKINTSIELSKEKNNDSTILIETFNKLVNELMLNNKYIFSILEDINSSNMFDKVSEELSQIKEYLGKNLDAEWDFYVDRSPSGVIERVRVKRIK